MFRLFGFYQQQANCDQHSIFEKIGKFHQQIGKPRTLVGHCHGLSTFWLRRMAQNRENEMYEDANRIAQSEDDNLRALRPVIKRYFKKTDKRQKARNLSIHELIKATKEASLDGVYLTPELHKLFKDRCNNGNMFYIAHRHPCLLGDKLSRHAMAVYIRDQFFYCYNSNYPTGRAKIFNDAERLVSELKKILYTDFKAPIPLLLSLEIKLIESQDFIINQKQKKHLEQEGTFNLIKNSFLHYSQYLTRPFNLFNDSKKRKYDQMNDNIELQDSLKKRKLNPS